MDPVKNKIESAQKVKVYGARWIILILYIISCASSTMQWIQYSIIADTVVKYYGVSYTAVDWSAMVYLLTYAIFGLIGSYLLEVLGLRNAFLIGMGGTCIGACTKIISVSPDKFWIVILGQAIVGASEVFIMPIPPKLAAVWFGPKEVSTACGLGLFGVQIGIATGFLIPPMIIDNQVNTNTGWNLYTMLTSVASINTILLIILFLYFKEQPPSPPSQAQLKKIENKLEVANFIQNLKTLFTNRSYVLLVISHGMGIGLSYALAQLLNQIILKQYPNSSVDAGRIGLIIVVVGMISTVIFGLVLDNFSKFKATTLAVHMASTISILIFTFTLDKGLTVVYITSALLGFFMMGYVPIGCELAAELTYPVEEGTSSGILLSSAQVFGIIFTYIYSYLLSAAPDVITNLVVVSILGAGSVLVLFIDFDLKRRNIQEENKYCANNIVNHI